MIKKQKKIIIMSVVIALIISAILIAVLPDFNHEIYLDKSMGMTSEQRLKDFNDMTKFIEKNVSFIYDYEELYGISFDDMKNYYAKLVRNAESDYEYYCLIQGFINNIPSGHMTMGYPNQDYIPELYKYRTSDYPQFGKACEYWENILHNECKKYYDEDYSLHVFYYLNGEYVESEYTNSVNNIPYSGARLLSVNGMPVDEFVKLCPLTHKLNYDFQDGKAFREILIFNNISGEKCTIEYMTGNGEVVSKNAYYGTSAVVSNYIEYFRSIDDPHVNVENNYEIEENNISNIYTFFDETNNIEYIKFNDFSLGGSEALKFIQETELPDNIIIDLRENGGGMKSICDALTGALSEKDIEFNAKIYTTRKYDDCKAERRSGLPFESRFKKLYSQMEENLICGKSAKKYNIYVLVSPVSLSAADRFAAIVKESGMGTVVGSFNTGGEAFGSPDIAVLEKSGLYFYFTDYKYINPDGTDNSVYGTAPDTYITLNDDFIKKRDELILQNINYETYENRMKWDNVLTETIEMIKENENDKRNNPSNE